MADGLHGEQSNTRWWESYLVRYFLGFIVGAVCVGIITYDLGAAERMQSYLEIKHPDKIMYAKADWTAVTVVLAILGMGYCYMASTPITVLHAGRYGRGAWDLHSRYFWFGWAINLGFSILVPTETVRYCFGVWGTLLGVVISSFLGIGFFLVRDSESLFPLNRPEPQLGEKFQMGPDLAARIKLPDSAWYTAAQTGVFAVAIWCLVALICEVGNAKDSSAFNLILFGLPIVWIGLLQYVVLHRILRSGPAGHQFYALLFAARRKGGSRDIRETYTHLREHANSIFVVLVELCWLCMILGVARLDLATSTLGAPQYRTALSGEATYLVMALGIWMVPTMFMWSRANVMERFFASRPETFLESGEPKQ